MIIRKFGTLLFFLGIAFGLLFNGCATTEPTYISERRSWIHHVNPTDPENMSDWEIFDISPDLFSGKTETGENIRFELMEMFY